jgi:DNA end-binding protein Ku
MARPIWTGVVSFGLVSVPVAMFPATREHDVSFHQFEKDTSDRIRYRRVNERTGKDVDYDNIVRGADVGDGQYVMLDPDELDSIAPGRSRSLEIQAFVDVDEIDPLYYQKTYYLAPVGEETAKTYALLRQAMAEANRAAIATFVMRGKEYLAAVRPDNDLLVLETMHFADEVRDPYQEIDNLPGNVKLRPAELRMAKQLIESMTGRWEPEEYRDTYTDRVNELIAAKKKGDEVTVAEEAPAATDVTDLMAVLKRSVEAAKHGRAAGAAKKTAPKSASKSASKAAPKAGSKSASKAARKAGSKSASKAASAKGSAGKKAAAAKKAEPAKKAATKRTPAKKAAGKKAAGKKATKRAA